MLMSDERQKDIVKWSADHPQRQVVSFGGAGCAGRIGNRDGDAASIGGGCAGVEAARGDLKRLGRSP